MKVNTTNRVGSISSEMAGGIFSSRSNIQDVVSSNTPTLHQHIATQNQAATKYRKTDNVTAGRSRIGSGTRMAKEMRSPLKNGILPFIESLGFRLTLTARVKKQEVQITKDMLTTISTEIQLMIFENLDRASSTCLGLASKHLYAIHKSIHGHVPLTAWCMLPPGRYNGKHLFELIGEWMSPLVFCRPQMKFVTQGQLDALKLQYEMSEWEFSTWIYRNDCKAVEAMIDTRIEEESELEGWFEGGAWVNGKPYDSNWQWDLEQWDAWILATDLISTPWW
jgi:hypothetical protein